MKENKKNFCVNFYYLKLSLIMFSVVLFFSCKHELPTVEVSLPKTTSTIIDNKVISETNFFKNNKLLGGDVKIFKSDIWADGKKSFERNISYYLFCELTKDKYGNLLELIKDYWKRNNYTQDGKYIAPLPDDSYGEVRKQAYQKIASNWKIFTEALKKEGKYINQ